MVSSVFFFLHPLLIHDTSLLFSLLFFFGARSLIGASVYSKRLCSVKVEGELKKGKAF